MEDCLGGRYNLSARFARPKKGGFVIIFSSSNIKQVKATWSNDDKTTLALFLARKLVYQTKYYVS